MQLIMNEAGSAAPGAVLKDSLSLLHTLDIPGSLRLSLSDRLHCCVRVVFKGSAGEKNYVNIKRPPAPHAYTVRTTLPSSWASNGGLNRSRHTPFPGQRLVPQQAPTDREDNGLRNGQLLKGGLVIQAKSLDPGSRQNLIPAPAQPVSRYLSLDPYL